MWQHVHVLVCMRASPCDDVAASHPLHVVWRSSTSSRWGAMSQHTTHDTVTSHHVIHIDIDTPITSTVTATNTSTSVHAASSPIVLDDTTDYADADVDVKTAPHRKRRHDNDSDTSTHKKRKHKHKKKHSKKRQKQDIRDMRDLAFAAMRGRALVRCQQYMQEWKQVCMCVR